MWLGARANLSESISVYYFLTYDYKIAEQHGPVSEAKLLGMFAEGAIDQDTPVWANGMSDWRPLVEVWAMRCVRWCSRSYVLVKNVHEWRGDVFPI